jgi:hypothetical protein
VNLSAIRPWVGTVFRLVLGGVFLWAGWEKLADPRGFVQAVRAYDVTPEWLSKAIGYGLPVLEVCLAALLIVGVITRIAAAVSAALMLVFLIGIVQAAIRGLKLECGCFGGGGSHPGIDDLHARHPSGCGPVAHRGVSHRLADDALVGG